MPIQLPEPRVLVEGLAMVESARWHDGRLWLAHWGTNEVLAVDLDGTTEVMAEGRPGLGWSIAWLPGGELLVTGEKLVRQQSDGSMVDHSEQGGNEIVVDGQGRIYLDGAEFDFLGGGAPEPGWIKLVEPDGTIRQVADKIDFPNGMVITPDGSTLVVAESMGGRLSAFTIQPDGGLTDRRVWAENLGPDGICVDAESAIWVQSSDTFAHTNDPASPAGACLRVLDGGEITHHVETDMACFSCTLGGPEGRHLFLLCNDWNGIEGVDEVVAGRKAKILVTEAPVPGNG